MSTLLLIHGRSQASPPEIANSAERVAAYVDAIKREWLGGLSRGLMEAGLDPVTDALFPFYGNDFEQRIGAYEKAGGRRPELELGVRVDDGQQHQEKQLLDTKYAALNDLLRRLDFDPARELSYTDPDLAERADNRQVQGAEELRWDDLLKVPVLRAGLRFLGRKTGVPTMVIEQFLTDVAYYLELTDMREAVLGIVKRSLHEAMPGGGDVVVVGHSLGSIVAYDFLTRIDRSFDVKLFVTAGSPLGLPIVEKNLLGKQPGQRPCIPAAVPARPGGWINAFDVRDVVALMHPLAPDYSGSMDGQLDDQLTLNSTYPHSISDYLSDPDVAAPIGRSLVG